MSIGAKLDLVAGVVSLEGNEFETGFSYFLEAFEQWDQQNQAGQGGGLNSADTTNANRIGALNALRYMILTKILEGLEKSCRSKKSQAALDEKEVSERSERAFWKTSIFAMKCAKWIDSVIRLFLSFFFSFHIGGVHSCFGPSSDNPLTTPLHKKMRLVKPATEPNFKRLASELRPIQGFALLLRFFEFSNIPTMQTHPIRLACSFRSSFIKNAPRIARRRFEKTATGAKYRA